MKNMMNHDKNTPQHSICPDWLMLLCPPITYTVYPMSGIQSNGAHKPNPSGFLNTRWPAIISVQHITEAKQLFFSYHR